MPSTSRGGFTRGTRPARPGDLTAKISRTNQARAEAAKRAKETDPYADGFSVGFDQGFDRGFDAGFGAALQQFKDAGLDVDAVLALADDIEHA